MEARGYVLCTVQGIEPCAMRDTYGLIRDMGELLQGLAWAGSAWLTWARL